MTVVKRPDLKSFRVKFFGKYSNVLYLHKKLYLKEENQQNNRIFDISIFPYSFRLLTLSVFVSLNIYCIYMIYRAKYKANVNENQLLK